jgi:xanthine dehydrogenase accessory factor
MSVEVYRAIVEAVEHGERAALVTIVATGGSTPQRVGAKLLVYEDGRTLGTIGGGCYEHDAAARAREAMRTGKPELVRYSLNDELAAESGLICGGQMDIYIEPIATASKLYIAGGGHIAVALARIANMAGFEVHVVDDRARFANSERFPDAAVVVDDIPGWFSSNSFPPDSYFVVVTRGHKQDLDVLQALVGREWRYLGLIGSRAKVLKVFDALASEGVSEDRLGRVNAPIGIDIGAVTPPEIAISIVAELIATRAGRAAEPHVAAASLRSSLQRLTR